jgi:hypothetical protein
MSSPASPASYYDFSSSSPYSTTPTLSHPDLDTLPSSKKKSGNFLKNLNRQAISKSENKLRPVKIYLLLLQAFSSLNPHFAIKSFILGFKVEQIRISSQS